MSKKSLLVLLFIMHCSSSLLYAVSFHKESTNGLHTFYSTAYRRDHFSFSFGPSLVRLRLEGSGPYNLNAMVKSKWNVANSISFSAFRQFNPIQFRTDFKIGYGLRYHQMNATSFLEQNFSTGLQEVYDFQFKFQALELPLYARYKFYQKKFTMSVSAGASFVIMLNKKDQLHYREYYLGNEKRNETTGAVYLNRSSGEGMMSSCFNAFGSISLDFPFLDDQLIFTEVTYCPYSNMANSNQVSMYPVFTDWHVGIRF
ncbi:MAG: hypothetical protein ACOVP1_07650 [Bacteroidia bacterium]